MSFEAVDVWRGANSCKLEFLTNFIVEGLRVSAIVLLEQVTLDVFEGSQIRKEGCLVDKIELFTRGEVLHHELIIRAEVFTAEAFRDVRTHREGKVVLVTIERVVVLRIVIVGRHVGRTLF